MNDYSRLDPQDTRSRIDVLTSAIKKTPGPDELVELYIDRAHCYNLLGDIPTSLKDYFDALDLTEKKSDRVHIKSMVALALVTKEQQESGLFWATSAVDEDIGNPEGHYSLGLVCDKCGFLSVAIEALRKALDLQPDYWDAMRKLGVCLREQCCLHESVQALSAYMAGNPHDPQGLYELGWSVQLSFELQDRKPQARELYRKALSENPDPVLRELIERKLKTLEDPAREQTDEEKGGGPNDSR